MNWWGHYDDENNYTRKNWKMFLKIYYKNDDDDLKQSETLFLNDESKYDNLKKYVHDTYELYSHPYYAIPGLCLYALKIVNNNYQYKKTMERTPIHNIKLVVPNDFPDELLFEAIEDTYSERRMEYEFDDPDDIIIRKEALTNQIVLFKSKISIAK